MTTILNAFTPHAVYRAKNRFKKYSIEEIEKDFNASGNKTLWQAQLNRYVVIGKLARYVISNDGSVVTLLPIKQKTRNKQFKSKSVKPSQKIK